MDKETVYLNLRKAALANTFIENIPTYKGIPIDKFNRDELIKIVSIFAAMLNRFSNCTG